MKGRESDQLKRNGMNWFKRCQSVPSKGFVKLATDNAKGTKQDAQSMTLFDVQRYVMDSYSVKVALSSTGMKIGVTIIVSHNFLGSIGWDAYWAYDLSEFSEANKMYQSINDAVQEVVDEFIKSETPTAIFWPTIRSRIEMLDIDHMTSTNIPHINYSRDIAIEPDWRKNIYGTRYPQYREDNYRNHFRSMRELWPNA